MKTLKGLHWVPRWVSYLGCVKGCLDYLGRETSDAGLYGGTGYAFVINLHGQACPSGPTAWKTAPTYRLGRNLKYQIDGVHGHLSDPAEVRLQETAWAHVREAMDGGRPRLGWELGIPEYHVITGYDEVGYYRRSGPGCDDGAGPFPWNDLGRSGIGVVEVCSMVTGPTAPDRTTVHDALEFALEHARTPGKGSFPGYTTGPEAFDVWAESLENGTAIAIGQTYNAAVWAECRRCAAVVAETGAG